MNFCAANDEAINLVKRSKIVDIYHELIKVKIDHLKIETSNANREIMVDKILNLIEKLREV